VGEKEGRRTEERTRGRKRQNEIRSVGVVTILGVRARVQEREREREGERVGRRERGREGGRPRGSTGMR